MHASPELLAICALSTLPFWLTLTITQTWDSTVTFGLAGGIAAALLLFLRARGKRGNGKHQRRCSEGCNEMASHGNKTKWRARS